MAETVGNWPATVVTTPVANDPLDPTVIVAHFNDVENAHNDHDDDPGIHFQSSTFASRPAAGIAGRKWLTVYPSGVATFWYDNGVAWVEVTGVTFPLQNGQPTLYDAGNSGSSITINWDNGPVQKVTLTGNATFTFSNPQSGSSYTLILVQDATGTRSVTLSGFDFGDNIPTFNTTATKKNVVSALYDGTEYLAAFAVKGA
jgi:hypothetical protein